MLKDLIKLSNELDNRGLIKEADYVDVIIKNALVEGAAEEAGKAAEEAGKAAEEAVGGINVLTDRLSSEPALANQADDDLKMQIANKDEADEFRAWLHIVHQEDAIRLGVNSSGENDDEGLADALEEFGEEFRGYKEIDLTSPDAIAAATYDGLT